MTITDNFPFFVIKSFRFLLVMKQNDVKKGQHLSYFTLGLNFEQIEKYGYYLISYKSND